MFDRAWTQGILNNAGPDAQIITLYKPDGPGVYHLEGWMSNFGSSNVHIFDGGLQLAECQGRLERGFVDVLLTLSGAAVVKRRLPDDVSVITVFFEAQNTSGQSQLATIRVYGE